MGNKSSLMLRNEEIEKLSDETGFSPVQIEKLYSRFAHLDRSNVGSLSRSDLMSIPELAINPLCDRLIQLFFEDCGHDEDGRINFRHFVRALAAFRSSSSSPSNTQKTNSQAIGLDHNENVINVTRDRGGNSNLLQVGELDKEHSRTHSIHSIKSRESNNKQHDISTAHIKEPSLVVPDSMMNENLRNKLLFVFKIYDADNDGRISFGDLKSILKMMVGNYIEDVQLDKIATRAFMEIDQDSDGFVEFGEFCRVFAGKDLDDKLRVKFFN